MDSHILEALPGIHGILIGLGAAFFSGFAMFAYQKLQESKDKLDKIISEVEVFSTPSNFIGGGKNTLIKDDGEMDWDGRAKELMHHAKSIFSYLDYEEKYGIPRNSSSISHTEDDISSTCRELCLMFHYLFVSYPFSGKSMVHVQGVTEKIENKKAQPFNKERLQEIERRISFLSWCWETNNRSLIALGQQCTAIETKKAEKDAVKSFNKSIARSPDISEEEKQRIWNTFHQPRLNMQTDYSQIISEYFNKVLIYRDRVLPQLADTIRTHETFNERFKFKSLTIDAFKIVAFIFVFGVVTPLLLLNFNQDYKLVWHSTLPYLLLALTTLPYVSVWMKLFGKVKNLEYK